MFGWDIQSPKSGQVSCVWLCVGMIQNVQVTLRASFYATHAKTDLCPLCRFYTHPAGCDPCMDHALSLLPSLVLSAHCNKEKAETVAQELLVETEGCSLVSFRFFYGPV